MDQFERFAAVVDEMKELHERKSKDYGVASDPLANLRASAEFGVAPWLGAAIRLNDKVQRLKSLASNGKLENESIRDSFIDIANYAVIALLLYEEEHGTQEPQRAKETPPT